MEIVKTQHEIEIEVLNNKHKQAILIHQGAAKHAIYSLKKQLNSKLKKDIKTCGICGYWEYECACHLFAENESINKQLEDLKKYLEHTKGCAVERYDSRYKCNCGLDKLLNKE